MRAGGGRALALVPWDDRVTTPRTGSRSQQSSTRSARTWTWPRRSSARWSGSPPMTRPRSSRWSQAIDAIPRRERARVARAIFDRLPAEQQWTIVERVFGDEEISTYLAEDRDQRLDGRVRVTCWAHWPGRPAPPGTSTSRRSRPGRADARAVPTGRRPGRRAPGAALRDVRPRARAADHGGPGALPRGRRRVQPPRGAVRHRGLRRAGLAERAADGPRLVRVGSTGGRGRHDGPAAGALSRGPGRRPTGPATGPARRADCTSGYAVVGGEDVFAAPFLRRAPYSRPWDLLGGSSRSGEARHRWIP